MKLVDTSSWVHALRTNGNADLRERVRELVESSRAYWCPMVRLELWNGAGGTKEKAALRAMERQIPELTIDARTWNDSCDLARRARDAGLSVPSNDLLIFACAQQHRVEVEHCDQHITALLALA